MMMTSVLAFSHIVTVNVIVLCFLRLYSLVQMGIISQPFCVYLQKVNNGCIISQGQTFVTLKLYLLANHLLMLLLL